MAYEAKEIEVTASDLPLHCPTKEVSLWCSHPRVFLDITASGQAMCPYCGTKYRLKAGEAVAQHH
ncbi:putative Zn-finger protein [Methylovorus glucosotrophus]|uniref:zinc-finger domain-containing protein n=1 Tax=Methylovorus glucosotrophus TaxID=266009 RepID=UPI0013319535|nr:zinc-finger domain-containing protein [Methylovorus glucosotrophus]KAF0843369.1 putative Zn-finger protein [Methylovorus glucosotrophus]